MVQFIITFLSNAFGSFISDWLKALQARQDTRNDAVRTEIIKTDGVLDAKADEQHMVDTVQRGAADDVVGRLRKRTGKRASGQS